MRERIKEVNPKEILLDNILAVMESRTFGKETAAAIVGGHSRLIELIAAGKIEASKDPTKRNGKWFCNARQVLENVRNMRRL